MSGKKNRFFQDNPGNEFQGNVGNELDINRQNREDYENLMKESSTNLDGYWDKNNIFVKLLLLVLGVIIIAGVVWCVNVYMSMR